MSETHSDVARALFAAIAAGDVATVDALYHDDAVVFMNTTGATLEKRKMLGVIRFLSTQVSQLRYEDVRLQPTPTGFVQQHVLACRAPGGEEVRAHACLVAVVEEGRIRRLDEYLDAAAIAPLTTPR
ncbi:MAG: nuclear transport factor 2 family protein [Polyangiales bacterium]